MVTQRSECLFPVCVCVGGVFLLSWSPVDLLCSSEFWSLSTCVLEEMVGVKKQTRVCVGGFSVSSEQPWTDGDWGPVGAGYSVL